jgi:hypothetical protein
LAISVNENWITAALVHSVYTGDKGGRLCSVAKTDIASDADSIGFARGTKVGQINVIVARSLLVPSSST